MSTKVKSEQKPVVKSVKKREIKEPSKVRITQIASSIGRKYDQEQTLIGLGLNKMHKSIILEDEPAIMGMVKKVKHLVHIEKV